MNFPMAINCRRTREHMAALSLLHETRHLNENRPHIVPYQEEFLLPVGRNRRLAKVRLLLSMRGFRLMLRRLPPPDMPGAGANPGTARSPQQVREVLGRER